MVAEIIEIIDGKWVEGIVNDGEYKFMAKVHNEGSKYGINEGRVSKLSIIDKFGYVMNYDRGWDIELDPAYQEVFDVVMEVLENSDKRWDVK